MTGESARPAIEANGLTRVYGRGNTEVVALRNVSVAVGRGELVALLGPSGAGKSTLLAALGLVGFPDSGRVVIDGIVAYENRRPQVDVRRFRREHIGFVFQKANLIPFLTALENVQLAAEIGGRSGRAARERAAELLGELGVADRARHLPQAMSAGQQQRVALARALANRPGLVLADEPTAALDRGRGRLVMELLARVARDHGAGVMVVTHDHRALDVFDRILEMEDGAVRPAVPGLGVLDAFPSGPLPAGDPPDAAGFFEP